METVYNFGAGPAKIPQPVLERAQKELINYDNTGMSVMELSHRSKPFGAILARTKDNLRKLMHIPDNYEILFMQGGATTQFSALVYNLVAVKQAQLKKTGEADASEVYVDYLVTGSWSSKAAQEADRLAAQVHARVNRVTDAKKQTGKYGVIPSRDTWQLSDPTRTAYVYYCDNETVHGVEFPAVPEVDPRVPLVADMSSNFLSRPVDVSKFGVIYGGAQKNLGPAGVTIVIIRKDLIADSLNDGPLRPLMLDYRTAADNDSMYNTPPTFAIYMVGLMLEWLIDQGGLAAIQKTNEAKAKSLYDAIDSLSLFKSPVDISCRSKMNVVFNMQTPELEKEFLKGAEERRMVQLKGHRSVGGIRASIYNAMPLEHINKLIEYMNVFQMEHST
ncbi:phosphoserine aminotransferase [Dichotomocladium elegans]|nr:phosphoserine aminotransferase [Dichotomocladium elegans]